MNNISLEQRQWFIMSIIDMYNGDNIGLVKQKLECIPSFNARSEIKNNIVYEDFVNYIFKFQKYRWIRQCDLHAIWINKVLGKRTNKCNRVFTNCTINDNERKLIHLFIENGFTDVRQNIICIFYADAKSYPYHNVCCVCENKILCDKNEYIEIGSRKCSIYKKCFCNACVDTLCYAFINVNV